MPEGSTRNTALTVNGVTRNFGGLVAVDDMTFDLKENEVLGLIGPNGSGKTTMINLISGALKPSSGTIKLFHEDITYARANSIAQSGISRTFQIVRILPTLSVLENVAAGGVFGHDRRWGKNLEDYARQILNRVGLENAEHTDVSALTYIDQKRLELARALASDAIRSLCGRCVVMNSGAKIAEGTPDAVLADEGVIRAYLGDEHA